MESSAAPGLGRRLASMLYEGTLLFSVAFLGTWLFQFFAGSVQLEGWRRVALQSYLGALFAAYFMWCWLRGGQTLAMKAWRIRLVAADGTGLTARQALVRFLLALVTVGGFGLAVLVAVREGHALLSLALLALASIGLAWALVDRDGQFLHDRLAGTRLVLVSPDRA
jgi:uncharacterized RDD family membrane protein YckC